MKPEKDVFISYAHLDDKPLDAGAKSWITDFHTLLETRLEQTIGYEINIWRDEKLTGNEVFTDEIESQLPKLKVMLITYLISRCYSITGFMQIRIINQQLLSKPGLQ